jgi:hypothetical protein
MTSTPLCNMCVLVCLPHVLQADLLSLIDSTGHGLNTVVRRSWDSTAVRLSLEGTWSKCAEARKMAMLAVYQVCLPAGHADPAWHLCVHTAVVSCALHHA